MLDALWTLPAKARAVVVVRYWEDPSVEQAAEMLGCSPGSVKSQSARSLDKLRALLDDAAPNPGSTANHGNRYAEQETAVMDEMSLRDLLRSAAGA